MSNQAEQRIVDLSYDIIKDSKRRTLYYDELSKTAFQINQQDTKWIRFYKLRLFLGLVTYFVSFLILKNLPIVHRFVISMLVGVTIYLADTLFFEKLFLKDKVPFKISQKDFAQRYERPVLIQKRMLQRYHLGFILIYGILVVMELVMAKEPLWIILLICGLLVLMSFVIIRNLLALRAQLKITEVH